MCSASGPCPIGNTAAWSAVRVGLETYADKLLIDPYDIHPHLVSCWLKTIKDDVYMLDENGWQAEVIGADLRQLVSFLKGGRGRCKLVMTRYRQYHIPK